MIKLTDIIFEGKLSKSEIKKMRDKFDKTGKLPPHLQKLADLMKKDTKVKDIVVPGLEWMADIKEGKLTEAKGKWAVINANDVLNMFAEKVVDTQKEAEKIAKQMKQKDKYGKYQAVSVKKWNQAKPGNKIKEGKLTEGKGVDKVLDMANNNSFGKLGGKIVDAMSANLFKTVYDKLNDANKVKIDKMNEKQLYVFMTKLWTKFGKQVRI